MDFTVGDPRLETILQLSDGRRVRGTIDPLAEDSQRQSIIAPYALRVNRGAVAHPGDVLLYEGGRYILGEDVTEAVGAPQFRVLRMFTSNKQGAWKRTVTVIDPVTKLAKGTSTTTLSASVDFSFWRLGAITDVFSASTSKYSIITAAALAIGDQLDIYTVTFAETHYGLTFAEVK